MMLIFKNTLVVMTFSIFFLGCAAHQDKPTRTKLKQQVMNTERAFSQTMADRDHEEFISFLSDEAIFFSGTSPVSGKQQVAALWKPYFETTDAPFSWEPKHAEVLESGTLALSTGPVHDPEGKLIATFTSIWRLEASGKWQIIFDKGNKACDCTGQ